MMKKLYYSIIINLLIISNVFARSGGGGSGGGGGGSSSSGGSGGGLGSLIISIIIGVVCLYIYFKALKFRKEIIEKTKLEIQQASQIDASWNEELIKKRVTEVFYSFQKDWSFFNVESMKAYLSSSYYRRMVLEMNVLKNEKRQNLVDSPNIVSMTIMDIDDESDNRKDKFVVEIVAYAQDKLIDSQTGAILFQDNKSFTEYWNFCHEDNIWKLDIIKQSTEDALRLNVNIQEFSNKNNFFFDPDFGWLMMPNKGVLFSKSNFMTTDINNHVIGYYRNKIVEFYTIQSNGNGDNPGKLYTVAQAILPIFYINILVKRKELLNFAPKGLREHSMESVDFNKKFVVFSDARDNVNSFELLAPDFMERIYALPFKMNIEIVDNFLYFYTEDKQASYDQMLEVISWAFDEMKM